MAWRCGLSPLDSVSTAHPTHGLISTQAPRLVEAMRRGETVALVSDCAELEFYGAFVLNHRVDLHANDASSPRWRGGAGLSPRNVANTAASSPRNDCEEVHPTQWLISIQVSDAGTPAVSDPGALLVRAARDAGLAVRALPGPCAATTALSASGFGDGAAGFSFLGFVEGRGASAARRRALRSALDAAVEGPAVLYESPRRVRQTLHDLDKLDGGASQRLVLIARELTKTHEETWRGALGDAVAYLDAGGGGAVAPGEPPRGEFTLVLDAKPKQAGSAEDAKARVAELRASGLSTSDAAKAAASELGLKKSDVYRLALDG